MTCMKKIVTLLVFVTLCQMALAQWTSIPNFSGAGVARSGSFSIGDTGYIIAGGNSWYVPEAYGYDTLSQSWFQISNYPGNDDDPICFSYNGMGYCVTGGTCCPGYSNTLYQYNPNLGAGGTWTTMAPLPGPARTFSVGFQIGSKMYVGGGVNNSGTASNSNPLNDFFCYDASTGIWDSIAPCPALGVNAFASGFAVNGEGYVGCGCAVGYNTGTLTLENDFWQYDPGSNTWTKKGNFPGGVLAGATSWATCSNGYICGGYTDPNQSIYTSEFWQYNPGNDTWTQLPNYGGGIRDYASAFLIGKSVFVGNGYNTTQLTTFWEYTFSVTPAFTTANASAQTICAGNSVAFTDTSNYSPTNWSWNFPGGTPDTSTSKNPVITYDTAGTYDVILTAWNGCDSATKTFSQYITVNPAPVKPLLLPKDTSFCGNFTFTLNSGTLGFKHLWSTGDTTSSISVTALGKYWVSVSNSCDTVNSDTVNVVVDSNTILTVIPQTTSICPGTDVTLKISGGGSNFVWSPSTALSATTGDSVIANPTASVTYSVSGLDSVGCPGKDSGIIITIVPAPNKPTITISGTGDSLISSAGSYNQWFFNDQPIQNATGQVLVITGHPRGYYYVVVTNPANGCTTTSDSTTSINQLSMISDQLSIYPNPFSNTIYVKINSSAQNVNEWSLQLTDVLGRTVYTDASLNYSNDIDLSNLPAGIYFIAVVNKTARAVFPVVKQN